MAALGMEKKAGFIANDYTAASSHSHPNPPGSLGITVIRTFWTRITRINTEKARIFCFSVRLLEIRAICVPPQFGGVRITANPSEPPYPPPSTNSG